jgi:hypothetical protein
MNKFFAIAGALALGLLVMTSTTQAAGRGTRPGIVRPIPHRSVTRLPPRVNPPGQWRPTWSHPGRPPFRPVYYPHRYRAPYYPGYPDPSYFQQSGSAEEECAEENGYDPDPS